ncbi:hypothetical protein D5R81_02990 [Parashewanella spongiae]|uniref:EscE/YscE/SsaE family type III secretion system needle protein co-chaperone n=1 Tax=Parashewanella spongiae TaxID=342950 RepID=A0A3A6UAB9_9GAMM|nr:hypothetical protein [Parashewanella spongiae]MCL1076967.1 hypothetical protein [Parashewanella spongiae]RJY18917.1 hypothetical protein D5R81_02990 [Parashewanella spongiae]
MPRLTKLEDDIRKRVNTLEEYQLRFELMHSELNDSEFKKKADFKIALDSALEVIELLYKRLKKRK